jgi:hypothetical protein
MHVRNMSVSPIHLMVGDQSLVLAPFLRGAGRVDDLKDGETYELSPAQKAAFSAPSGRPDKSSELEYFGRRGLEMVDE